VKQVSSRPGELSSCELRCCSPQTKQPNPRVVNLKIGLLTLNPKKGPGCPPKALVLPMGLDGPTYLWVITKCNSPGPRCGLCSGQLLASRVAHALFAPAGVAVVREVKAGSMPATAAEDHGPTRPTARSSPSSPQTHLNAVGWLKASSWLDPRGATRLLERARAPPLCWPCCPVCLPHWSCCCAWFVHWVHRCCLPSFLVREQLPWLRPNHPLGPAVTVPPGLPGHAWSLLLAAPLAAVTAASACPW
jgi:hypothetical protein